MLGSLIGKTPMIKINYEYNGKVKAVYVKLEYYNLTGSIKDRVAFYMINKAYECGKLKKGMPIIEATSGNTGISLAAIGAYYKHPVYIFMPDWVSEERVKLIKSYGARVTLVSKEEGGFKRCLEKASELVKQEDGFLVSQFSNGDNTLAHMETTGVEILKQMDVPIGGFVSGVGTGGTLMGVGHKLKGDYSLMVLAVIEPDKMPIILNGRVIGQHKIEGIGDDFIPDLLDRGKIDRIILVNDDDAINMALKLSRDLGLGVGFSSGANMIGSILLSDSLDNSVVTIFVDDNKKYLSVKEYGELNLNNSFISNRVKLLNYEVI